MIKICIYIISTLFLFCASDAGAGRSGRIVNVYYYPWYGSNIHWPDGYLRGKLFPSQPPSLGEYNSRDTAVINQHLRWSDTYGINNWICSWWGPNSYEDVTIHTKISAVIEAYHATYCLFYESAGLLTVQNSQISFDSANTAKLRSDFMYIANSYFPDPKYLRINGRPVVFIYLTRIFTGNYAQAFQLVRKDIQLLGYTIYLIGDEVYWGTPTTARIATLDAITGYNMHGPSQYAGYPSATNFISDVGLLYDQYSAAAKQLGVGFIPNTMAGFNDRAVRLSSNHYIIPNKFAPDSDDVSTLRQFTKMAISHTDSSLNMIAITSFNEWHEDTEIEPTIDSSPTSLDNSQTGYDYTLGYSYAGYGLGYLEVIRSLLPGNPTRVQGAAHHANKYMLGQNYPNPFNPVTTIRYQTVREGRVTMMVYNLIGQEVSTPVDGEKAPGAYEVRFDGGKLPSGIYFYRMSARGYSEVKKMLLLK